MRRSWRCSGFLLLAVPSAALGAEAARTVLDFTKPGPLKTYFDLSMSVARSYLPLAVILAALFEMLGHAPGTPRNFAAVVWRIVVILFLVVNYQRVFGFVIETTDDIADRLSPPDALDEYHKYMDKAYDAKEGSTPALQGTPEVDWATGETRSAPQPESRWSLGNLAFDGVMGVLLFLAKALVYGLERLARILTAVFFILGPLALVAGIPRPSNTASKWFHHYVTVAAWPIFSGVLLGVMTAVAKQSVANGGGTALGNLTAAVVMGLCALAAPILSGWIIGGAAQNVASLGHASFENTRKTAAQVAAHLRKMLPRAPRGGSSGASGGGGEGGGNSSGSATGSTAQGRTRGAVGSNSPVR